MTGDVAVVPDERALSLMQPWLWMVLYDGKGVENRKWNTKFRGEFLLHASSKRSPSEYDAAQAFADGRGLITSLPPIGVLPYGKLCGRARLVDVIPPHATDWPCPHRWHIHEQFGFLLEDVHACAPVTWKGALSFFRVPGRVAAAVRPIQRPIPLEGI